jgi:diguanylate cyclase (GGDEF)-like protein
MLRVWLTALACVCAVAAAVLVASETQRSTAEENFSEAQIANQLLTGMLKQGRGISDFAATGRLQLLGPFVEGRQDFTTSFPKAKELSSDDTPELRSLAVQRANWRRFQVLSRHVILEVRHGTPLRAASVDLRALNNRVDAFERANDRYSARLSENRQLEEHRAALVPLWMVLGLSVLFGSGVFLVMRRQQRRQADRQGREAAERAAEIDFVESQSRFGEAMQVAQDQPEAHLLLKRHLEREIPKSSVVVLNRNNSADRLEASEELAEDDPLREPLEHAEPRSCLAVRLSRHYRRGTEKPEVLRCELCNAVPSASTCQPLLVGGEVIGSVLVEHQAALDRAQDRRIDESVTQAAPVLANLRNLAIAETRAATDPLTGLPNKRAFDDAFKRMLAQSGRNLTPLSIALLDLDHFKKINDNFGHERGDEVLAALGVLLRAQLRAGDFPARLGGEEFVALLPDTDRSGAMKLAEALRRAIHGMKIGGLNAPVTASIGISTYPDDSTDAAHLMRTADRALYAAKQAGRDRVETVSRDSRSEEAEPPLNGGRQLPGRTAATT